MSFRSDDDDDLSKLKNEAVPDDVRKWLAATFASPSQVAKKAEERPTLKSVANAIRTGIFIEKIYSKMSTTQAMVIPPPVANYLEVMCHSDCHSHNPSLTVTLTEMRLELYFDRQDGNTCECTI